MSTLVLLALLASLFAACRAGGGEPAVAVPPSAEAITPHASATALAPQTSTATPEAPADAPLPTGFPLDPSMQADRVMGVVGARTIEEGGGRTVREVSVEEQISDDGARANASGWNCRVHVEYEGTPAIDWYVPTGTPVYATMDGDAILVVNTPANAFDYYDVSREPYIGDPDRSRAPLSPFPGPSGGMGVYVSLINDAFRTDYGHLELALTLDVVPVDAFATGYSRSFDFASAFAVPQPFTFGVQVASWPVRKGDVIGYTGDAGYSEAPHLHYVITRRATGERLCPTAEPGFEDAGWLSR